MVILPTRPPNFDKIAKAFPVVLTQKGIVYTYGGAIFNPDDCPIDEPLGLHEATHSLQQDKFGSGSRGPERWWKQYLKDPKFRLEQELEAYRNQYRRYCELNLDRNRRARFLNRIALDLASPQYGSVISLAEARKAIADF